MKLADSDVIARDAEKVRARLVMLAARDLANRCVAHALALADIHAEGAAVILDEHAKQFREIEREAAARSGASEE